jgi:AraC-like DNA-binding protein
MSQMNSETEDFSSGILVQLITKSFARQGILEDVQSGFSPENSFGPKVGLQLKRTLLENGFSGHGANCVLEAGLNICTLYDSPFAYFLLRAKSVDELLDRFSRFERYFHSRHGTEILAKSANQLTVRQFSKTLEAPLSSEDLFIAGLLAGLLKLYGCLSLSLAIGGIQILEDGQLIKAIEISERTTDFDFSWKGIKKVNLPAFDGEETLLSSLTKAGQGPYSRKVGRLLLRDLGRRWTVREIALELNMTERTLQRRLSEEGSGFGDCIMAVRCQMAIFYMTEKIDNLAAVGFLAGFSDAAHFSREFKKAIGMLPSEFKASL